MKVRLSNARAVTKDKLMLEMHSRTRLPTRRPNLTDRFEWGGVRFTVTVGFDERGAIREVFADGVKVGSDTEGLLDDACILVSLLLQHGYTPGRLAGHLLREADAAQSVMAAIAQRLVDIDQAIARRKPCP